MELASLLVKIGITGVNVVESGLSRVEKAVRQTAKSGGQAELSLLGVAGAAGLVAANVGRAAVAFSAVSGIGVAARFQKLEQGFSNILGSATAARGLMDDLRKMGASTEFNTEELTGFARLLLATGSTARSVRRELAALADATAFTGGNTSDVGALALNLSQIRQAIKPELEDLKQFGTRGISLGKVVGAATGETLDSGQAIRKLQGMSGQKAFETILTGMEKAFGGSAIRNAGTLLGVVQNLNEAFGTAMLPTGKLLVPVLTTVATGIKAVGEGLGKFNEMTNGSAGLVVLIGGLWRGAGLLTGTLSTAVSATRALTASLAQYSGVAIGAAAAKGIPAAQFAPGVAIGAPQGASNRIGGPFGIRTAISKAGGLMPLLGNIGKGALSRIGGGPLAFLASMGLGFAGDKIGGTAGGVLGGIGQGVGIGSLGFLGGPILGAITTIGGGIIGGIKGYFDAKGKENASNPMADDMKAAAKSLRNIEVSIIGAGRRGQRVSSEINIEAAMGRILATGIG